MSTNGSSNPPAEKISVDQNSSGGDLSKDEVGWYFVEQYYKTVSKNPEKLHLFYGKKSQFVYGAEAEVAKISVGRQPIQERIKLLDFQDCKVRISNVDTQASYDNLVIQVIGEFSNKAGEPKKFVQTFVLAQQPSGYFVLNDILRVLNEDDDEATESQEPTAPAGTHTSADEAAASQEHGKNADSTTDTESSAPLDATVVDKRLEQVTKSTQPADNTATEPVPEAAEVAPEAAKEPSDKATTTAKTVDADAAALQITEEDVKEPEKPKDPNPTPVASKMIPTESEKPAVPAPPPALAKPMTWASRLAASTGGAPKPVVPLKAPSPAVPTQTRAPAVGPGSQSQPAQASQPATPAVAAVASQNAETQASARKDVSEWQTAGEGSKRQNRPQSVIGPAGGDKESTACYVKYVSDKVQSDELKAALSGHGEVTYFDINRAKNCAFADFATVQGYQAAIAASPYTVNGESIVVEARRKHGGYGGSGYGPSRGGMAGRGRGGFDGGRSGSQRGSFGPQGGRGRGSARGSRGGAQASSS